ncbi:hypothetical protein [Nocardia brasiliensis]|uniref:hypothetical protein n=1 Tax=Nocardia brasiliensis TaxID=37326 RepID=UPI003CC7FD52
MISLGPAPPAAGPPGMVSPLSLPSWTMLAAFLFATKSKWGLLGGLVTLATALVRLRRVFAELDNPTRIAAIYLSRGFFAGLWRLASAMCRHYWPVTLLAMLASRRIRRIAITMAVADGLADWFTHRDAGGLDPVRYVAYKRLDDIAYGTGLWVGAFRARSPESLKPTAPSH